MGFLPCSLPCQSKKKPLDSSDQTQSRHLSSNSSSSLISLSSRSLSLSLSSRSFSSQPSLPSIRSLSISSSQVEHLSNTFHHCLATLTGHSSYIFCLSIAEKYLYCGSSNGEILVWDINPSRQDNCFKGKTVCQNGSAIKSIVIMGDKLFSAHQDHRIRVWKIDNETPNRNYKCIATLPTINDRCMKLFWTRNYVQVRRHKKCTWVHHVDTVSALALSKDGSLLYSASWDRTFKIWRSSDFKCLESVWNAHDDAINSIVVSNNGHVYTGSADKKIKIWTKQQEGSNKHTLMTTLEKHKSAVNALALSTDGSVLYSGACDRSIIVWEKLQVLGALRGHKRSILCLAVVSNDLLCSGSADKTVRIWKRGFGKSCYSCLAVFEGHNGPVKCLTATLDSQKYDDDDSCSGNSYLIYSGSLDCDVKVWKLWVPNYLS
ncbi:protein JINGUBANG-like [Solanum stenotomum]|uniref:protein JINGUBANG-like n=1 Tax=Solanum stenotomum TaxID=172797 RepID=UPI0020D089C2|nr:protein JINGUBANG-like [Solanum stenotomum]